MFFPVLLLRRLYQKQKFILLAILVIILLRNMRAKRKESFITYGDYPNSVDFPLLNGVYPLKKDIKLSQESRDHLYELYPIHPANSPELNNVKEWKSPDNGNCSPAELCNAIYDIKPVQAHPEIQSPSDPWNSNRIGFF